MYKERNPAIACKIPEACLKTPYIPNASPMHLKIKNAMIASHCKL